eukprot:g1355.t1
MTPEFRKALWMWERDEKRHGKAEHCAGYQLQRLFAFLRLSDRGAVGTAALTRSFGWNIRRIGQQDCQECMAVILDFFLKMYGGTTLAQHALQWRGVELSYIHCQETNRVRPCGVQPFWALRLQIEGMKTLDQAFKKLLEPELMTGDNKIMNPELGRKTDSKKGVLLAKLPDLLTIQLQRYSLDMRTLRQIKINSEIEIPFSIDLAAYAKHSKDDPLGAAALDAARSYDSASKSSEDDCDEENHDTKSFIFDLCGVVIHVGGVTSGHYFSYILDPNDRLRKSERDDDDRGRWIMFNDASVVPIDPSSMRRIFTSLKESSENGQESKSSERSFVREMIRSAKEGLDDENESQRASESKGDRVSPKDCARTVTPKGGTRRRKGRKLANALKHAYVLLYRRRTLSERTESSVDDLVSKALRQLVIDDNEAYAKQKAEWEYERKMIDFSIHYDNQRTCVQKVRIHGSKSVADLVAKIRAQIKCTSSVEIDRIRLRRYDVKTETRREPLTSGASSKGDTPLETLKFDRCRHNLFVEIKSPTGDFERWIRGGITVRVLRMRASGDGFESPKQGVVSRSGTVGDLRKMCAEVLGVTALKCLLVLFRGANARVLIDDDAPLCGGSKEVRSTVGIKDGEEVRVEIIENVLDADVAKRSLAVKYFDNVLNRISLRLYPVENGKIGGSSKDGVASRIRRAIAAVDDARAASSNAASCNIEVHMDRRLDLDSARRRIAEMLQLSPRAFKLLRGVQGPEMKNPRKSLKASCLRDGDRLYIEMGTPSECGQYTVRVAMLRSDAVASKEAEEIVQVDAPHAHVLLSKVPKLITSGLDDAKKPMPATSDAMSTFKCLRNSSCTCPACQQSLLATGSSSSKESLGASKGESALVPVRSTSSWSSVPVTQIGKLHVTEDTTNRELKLKIHDAFGSKFPDLPPASHMRLRERGAKALKTVYCDSKPLGKNTKVRDGLEIVVQRTAVANERISDDSLLLAIRRWYPNRLRLGPREEISVSKTSSLKQLKNMLSTRSKIPAENVALAKPFAYKLSDVKSIPDLKWNNRRVFGNVDATLGGRKGLSLRNGAVIVYKDARESEKIIFTARRWFPSKFKLSAPVTIAVERVFTVANFKDLASSWSGIPVGHLSLGCALPKHLAVSANLPNLAWDNPSAFGDADRSIAAIKKKSKSRAFASFCLVFKDSRKKERDVKPTDAFLKDIRTSHRRPVGGVKIYTPEEIRQREEAAEKAKEDLEKKRQKERQLRPAK